MSSLFRLALSVASLSIVAVVGASFDLFLMPTLNGRVSRYDPINRVSLGQFGPGTTPSQVFSSSAGTWVLNANNRYSRNNYATGELINQSSVFPSFISNTIAGTNTNGVTGVIGTSLREVNLITGLASTVAALNPLVTYYQVARMSNGNYVLMGRVTGTVEFVAETYTSGGSFIDSLGVAENVF